MKSKIYSILFVLIFITAQNILPLNRISFGTNFKVASKESTLNRIAEKPKKTREKTKKNKDTKKTKDATRKRRNNILV